MVERRRVADENPIRELDPIEAAILQASRRQASLLPVQIGPRSFVFNYRKDLPSPAEMEAMEIPEFLRRVR